MRVFSSCSALILGILAGGILNAASQFDTELILRETTYRIEVPNTAGNSSEFISHERWRALTRQGRTELSKVQISYIASFENVEFKFIKTIKKDGTVIDGDPTSAFDTAAYTDAVSPVFDDSKFRTILPPNFETGDTVEFEAIRHIRQWTKSGEFWLQYHPVAGIPALSETVTLDLPADRKVSFHEVTPGKVEVANGRRVERWVTTNRRADSEASQPLFSVSSLLTWNALGAWVLDLNKAEQASEITALAAKLTAGKMTDREKIGALYAFVATKVRYISVSFGIGRIQPHRPTTVLNNAYGDCKDQAALLSALAKAAGFTTHAVLTTPGAGVAVKDVPSPDQFNHEFIAVDTKDGLLFLDPSMGPMPAGVMQPGVRGRSALLIGDKGTSIIEIPTKSPVPNRIVSTLKGKVSATGAFEGTTRFEFEGIPEFGLRRMFLDASEEERGKALRQFSGGEFRNAKVRQVSTADPNDLTEPFWIQCALSDSDFFPSSSTEVKIGLEVLSVAATAAAVFTTHPKAPDKPLPVEALSVSRNVDIAVDPAFTISNGVPVHRKVPFGSFDSTFSYDQGHQLLSLSMELNGTPIAPSDWTAMIDFFNTAVTAQSFTLERHPASSFSTRETPATRAMEEANRAYQRHDYEAAKKSYLEVIKLDPQHVYVWNDLGLTYRALHQYDKAEEAYRKQIEINPKDLYVYNNLGVVLRALKRNEEAIAAYRKQIAIAPRDQYAHDNLAILFASLSRWEEARAESAIAVGINPGDPLKLFRLGKAQVKTGQIKEASKTFENALAQVHDAMTENNIAYNMVEAGLDLNRAWQLISGTLNPEARLACQPEKLVEDEKCSAQLRQLAYMLDTAGWILYRQGKVAEAEPYISSAVAIVPRAENEVHLAILLANRNRPEEALKYFASASSIAGFAALDLAEAKRELAKVFGGETQFEARLRERKALKPATVVSVLALVDEQGKVVDARASTPSASAALIAQAKTMKLPPIAWPGHSLRSLRIIRFRQEGDRWLLTESSVPVAP